MRSLARCMGICVAAFGLGLLMAFFLPKSALIVLEAVVIIIAGVFFLWC